MKRFFEAILCQWRNSSPRKPLLLQGARQVGKTWLLKMFGQNYFDDFILLDFAEDPKLSGFFQADLKPDRILTDLSVYLGRDIFLDHTLLIFDEVQHCPQALTSLKYFHEAYPEAYICASGSLLGLGLSQADFPVGKVRREWLRPMSFCEFLEALDETRLIQTLRSAARERAAISPPIHNQAFALLKEYLITGGMPEVVETYRNRRDTRVAAFKAARTLQRELAESYLDDIAKHSGPLKAVRIAALFNSIPVQLAREHKGIRKFLFKEVLPGRSTYELLEGPLEWLIRAGLVHRVPICRTVRSPLGVYAERSSFMLYLFDVGILGAMLHLDPALIHQYDFGQFKGFLAENLVLTELICAGEESIYSWRGTTAEIEFLLEKGADIVPVEVKSGLNTKAKSLQAYRSKYAPAISLLFSALGVNRLDDGLLHAPLYLAADTIKSLFSTPKAQD